MKLMKVTTIQDALEIIANEFRALETEVVVLSEAGGRILAKEIISAEDVPGFNRSTVDGYAIMAEESFGASDSIPAIFDLTGEILMGAQAPAISAGQCYLVHTGGMLPSGADAVIMIENTELVNTQVHCYRQVGPGENIIRKGEDLKENQVILHEGKKIRAPELGLLASIGTVEITVYRKPLVGIFSSGDELVEYTNQNLANGQIRNCNSISLAYMVKQFGGVPLYGGILPDQQDHFIKQSQEMLENVDFLVFSGGSSVGNRDYTAITMQELGNPGLLIEGLAVQPGKPTLLAKCNEKPVLGLPGHPISAMNIFALLGKTIISHLVGNSGELYNPSVKASISRNIPSKTGRTDYVRVKIDQQGEDLIATPIFGRSGILRTLSEANGLIIIPAAKEGLYEGEQVEIYLLD